MDREFFTYKYLVSLAPFNGQIYCYVWLQSKVINLITCMSIFSKKNNRYKYNPCLNFTQVIDLVLYPNVNTILFLLRYLYRSWNQVLQVLFIFFPQETVFAILGSLYFHINFRSSLPTKKQKQKTNTCCVLLGLHWIYI